LRRQFRRGVEVKLYAGKPGGADGGRNFVAGSIDEDADFLDGRGQCCRKS
jgi:hypothetical protein